MVASNTSDVSFIVLLASTGMKGAKVLLQQQELMANAAGIPKEEIEKSNKINSKIFELIINSKDDKELKIDLEKELRVCAVKASDDIESAEMLNKNISAQVNQLTTPWMKYFLNFDPSSVLEKVKCRVLTVNGEKDLQVAPKENLNSIQHALNKGNKKATVMLFPNLNHLFQNCNTGLPSEYGEISETFSPDVLWEITK